MVKSRWIFCLTLQFLLLKVSLASTPLESFADIVEPLMPKVVNINTTKLSGAIGMNDAVTDVIPLDNINKFFNDFNVPLNLNKPAPESQHGLALGSGFIIDPSGYIITNYHVIQDADQINVTLYDKQEFIAQLVGADPRTDLALIKITAPTPLSAVTFADSTKSRVGDVVIAIGNPLGFGSTVTTGIISSKGRDLGANQDELVDDFIQTDAAINTGNSGGPLFNIHGQVVGMNSSIPNIGDGTNIGIGFAIPADTIQRIMHKLQTQGSVKRGRLDIDIQDLTVELAQAFELNIWQGVLVVNVKQGGSGEQAGLRQGDVIVKVNDEAVISSRKLQLAIAEYEAGEQITLTINRQSQTMQIPITISPPIALAAVESVTPTQNTLLKGGVIFTDLPSSQENNGVMVVGLSSNSSANLQIGDVVINIDHQKINNLGHFQQLINALQNAGKRQAILLIQRQGNFRFAVISILD